jgi:hypothetical protein
MKKIFGGVAGAAFFFLLVGGYMLEYARPIPENLTVYVVNDPGTFPEKFYSSPEAYRLMNSGVPLAKMAYSDAKRMGIPMDMESQQDFSCWHNWLTWQLTDYGLWPNYCRWNSKGEWQNVGWYAKALYVLQALVPGGE